MNSAGPHVDELKHAMERPASCSCTRGRPARGIARLQNPLMRERSCTEISAYGTARTLAGQAGLPTVAELLATSLAEEEVSDNLLTQIARELMSEARTGLVKAPK